MKLIKRTISMILCIILLLVLPASYSQVSAEEIHNLYVNTVVNEVDNIINELAILRGKALLNNDLESTTEYSKKISALEMQLYSYNVVELTQEEVALLQQDVSVCAYVPSTTASVRWYSQNITYLYNGTAYVVQRLYAQGLDSTSNLCGLDAATFYLESSTLWEDIVDLLDEKVITVYAQKMVGLVPIIKWLPYEWFFEDDGIIPNQGTIEAAVTFACAYVGTVCFMYVYPAGSPSSEKLSYVSNSFIYSGATSSSWIKDGEPKVSASTLEDITINSTNYAHIATGIKQYLNNLSDSVYTSYVDYMIMVEEETNATHKVTFPAVSDPEDVY